MSVLRKCWARFAKGFGPVAHSASEVFFMRLCFAAIVILALPDKGDVGGLTAQEYPVGLAHFIDLTWAAGWMEPVVGVGSIALNPFQIVLVVALSFYVFGCLSWLALPVATLVFCVVGGLWNSQGVTRHTVQIVGLVLLVQSVCYVAARIRVWRGRCDGEGRLAIHRSAVWFSQQTIVAAYVITAISKIVISGGEWIKDSKFYPLQIEKTRLSDHYNHLGLDVESAGGSAPAEAATGFWERGVAMLDGLSLTIQNYLIANPNMCRTMMAAGLALEFFAFLALRGRLALFLYGIALVGFHLTIGRVMNLHFTIHNLVILTFMVNIPFLFLFLWNRMFRSGTSVGDTVQPGSLARESE